MSFTNQTKKNTYSGDGVTAAFAFSFPILAETDLLVQIKDTNGTVTSKTITTHYTVSGTGNRTGFTDYTSGTVTFTAGNIPAATDTIIIKRNVPGTQETDYTEKGAFPAETHERALDKLTMLHLQQTEDIDRSLKVDSAVSGFDGTLPTPVADKFIKVDSAGTGLELSDDTSVIGALSKADGTFYVGDGTTVVAESGSTARDSLGLGTSNSPQFTGIELGHATDTTVTRASAGDLNIEGNIVYRAGGTDVPVTDGGTGASTAADARTNLGLAIGTDVQAYDAGLADVAGLTPTDSNIIVGDGANWVAESGATARTSLGLGTGDNVTFTNVTATGSVDFQNTAQVSRILTVGNSSLQGGEIRFEEDTDNGTNYVALKAADSLGADTTWVLPTADGSSGEFLQTDGAGNLTFAATSSNLVQVVTANHTSAVSSTSYIAQDSTTPQNTEGYEVVTLAITPTSASNKLIINYSGSIWGNTSIFTTVALFQDSTASALMAWGDSSSGGGRGVNQSFQYVMTAGTTSSTTFKIRVGTTTGTYYLNRNNTYSTPALGVEEQRITIYEVV